MSTPATGNVPFEFTDPSTDGQVSIPLSAFSFDASGNLNGAPPWDTVIKQAPASSLLQYAQSQGLIVPAPTPSPIPAIIVQAADPLGAGNVITITIQNVVKSPSGDPTETTFDIVVTENDNYISLTCASIEAVLGSETTKGTQPGLLHAMDANPETTPIEILTPESLVLTSPGPYPLLEVPESGSPSGTAFTLEAKREGQDGAGTTVTISNVEGNNFDLTATLTQSATGLTTVTLQDQISNGLSYLINVKAPAGGFSPPAPATITLTAGATTGTLFAIQ
jgi:hypothetical protein